MTTQVEYKAGSADDGAAGSIAPAPMPSVTLDGSVALMALRLLAHLWRRPVAEELGRWDDLAVIEEQLRHYLPVNPGRLNALVEAGTMLGEYERLFVGPGPVPCSPYESFWRLDVPLDIRGSLMGPCTVELRRLYGELGLEVRPSSGELPDHLAIELEALTFAVSEGRGDVARALYFDHLRTWLPRLCRAVLHQAEHPFYLELASATLEWLKPLGRCLEMVPPVAASS